MTRAVQRQVQQHTRTAWEGRHAVWCSGEPFKMLCSGQANSIHCGMSPALASACLHFCGLELAATPHNPTAPQPSLCLSAKKE